MANAQKGEVEFKAGGDAYKLSFSANALCELEDAVGKGLNQIIAEMQDLKTIRIATMRTIFWAGLIDHHPEVTRDGVKSILKLISIGEMTELVSQAFALAMPPAEGDANAENPPTPGQPSGTGPVTSEPGAASV